VQHGNLFTPIQVSEEELAEQPVRNLFDRIKGKYWHTLNESFTNAGVYEEFCQKFGIDDNEQKQNIFIKKHINFKVLSITQLSSSLFGKYDIEVEVSETQNPSNKVDLTITTSYDQHAKNYFIESIIYSGQLKKQPQNKGISAQKTSSNSDPFCNYCDSLPSINASPCDPDIDFKYIKLSTRQNSNSPVSEHQILGNRAFPDVTFASDEAFNSQVFTQIDFNKLVDDDDAPEVGPVLSIQDLNDYELKDANDNLIDLFRDITDGDGVFNLTDDNGNSILFPTAVLIDNPWKRIIITSSVDQNIQSIGGFQEPLAVTIIGTYAYILDKGTNKIKIYQLIVNSSDELSITFISNTNFGLNLSRASDLAGFTSSSNNVLYIADETNRQIHRLLIDPFTGLLSSSSNNKITISSYTNYDGQQVELPIINRFESSPRSSGNNVLLMLGKRPKEAVAVLTDGLSSSASMQLLAKTEFPFSIGAVQLTNVGYNVGNGAFYITDYRNGKIHAFSGVGFYLGSGGTRGTSQIGNQLIAPNTISSNTFENNAIEMLVANRWTQNTGFKRILPYAYINDLEVIEKVFNCIENIDDNTLNFKYSLTAGLGVSNIKIKINGQQIENLTSGFYPHWHTSNFLETDISDKLQAGWNTYTVELTALNPSGNQYTVTKSIEFYFIPSHITTDFKISNNPSADIQHNSTDNPFYIYKSIKVCPTNPTNTITFTIENGKTIFQKNAILNICQSSFFYANNEVFEYECGGNLRLDVKEDVNKEIRECSFNGTLSNYNMISCIGHYTGGVGSAGSPSSDLRFISCRFDNYLGKAIDLIEGRAAIADCIFESTNQDATQTSVAIFASPNSRLDVRGGEFLNNDIAIDANSAKLFIGHHSQTFDGTPVGHPLFDNNKIAIFSFGCFTKIIKTDFTNNRAAIIDLNGTINASLNNENLFQNNTNAIIFSNGLHAEMGKNIFIDNETDITNIYPPTTPNQIEFNYRCNYWEHDGTIGEPVIKILENGTDSNIISFISEPYLEINNGGQYACTGGQPGNQGGNVDKNPNDLEALHPYHEDFLNNLLIDSSDTDIEQKYSAILSQYNFENTTFIWNEYLNNDVSTSWDEAIKKNYIYSYLLNCGVSNYLQEYNRLTNNYDNYYTGVAFDRLTLLGIVENGFVQQDTSATPSSSVSSYSIKVYPSPIPSNGAISFDIANDGYYSINIYDIHGTHILNVVNNQWYDSGQYTVNINLTGKKPGVYFAVLTDNNGNVLASNKFVLVK